MTSRIRALAALVTVISLGLAAPAARADDGAPPPAPPKTEVKPDAPKADGSKPAPDDGRKPDDAAPAATAEQVLADLADTKFVARRLDAANAAKDLQDPKLTPALAKLLKDEYPGVRSAAIAALGARTDPEQRKKAAEALAQRLGQIDEKVEHETERGEIVDALHDLAQVASIDALIDKVGTGTPLDEVEARCRAVANVPSPKAIEALIGFMQKRHRDGTGYRSVCNKALQYATGERGANDADMWRAWWRDHEKSFDFLAAYDKRRADAAAKQDAADRKERAKEKAREKREKKEGGEKQPQ